MADQIVDPLDQLVMKAEDVEGEARKLLAELLVPHVRMDPECGKIFFVTNPSNLTAKQQVLVYLLAKLAMAQKNDKFDAVATPKDVEESTGLPGGTIRPKLIELFKEKIISKSDAGYFVQASNLHKAKALLEDTLIKK